METLIALLIIYGIGRLIFGKRRGPETYEDRKNQTFFKYPKGGYGLDDDPVMDELFFLDIMDESDKI